jgi:hypothetical protein
MSSSTDSSCGMSDHLAFFKGEMADRKLGVTPGSPQSGPDPIAAIIVTVEFLYICP